MSVTISTLIRYIIKEDAFYSISERTTLSKQSIYLQVSPTPTAILLFALPSGDKTKHNQARHGEHRSETRLSMTVSAKTKGGSQQELSTKGTGLPEGIRQPGEKRNDREANLRFSFLTISPRSILKDSTRYKHRL